MLSQLRRFELIDKGNHRAPINDFVMDLAAGDYPPVRHLLFHDRTKNRQRLNWDRVEHIDIRRRQIRVSSLTASKSASSDWLKKAALLNRDILDALVLDLQNRHATRANDLWLEEDGGQLLLRAADTSLQAIFRRLTHSLVGKPKQDELLYDWKYVEFLRGDMQAASSGASYHRRISRLLPGEIAALSEALPYLHAAELLTLLPDPLAADTLELMGSARQLQVFEELEEGQALRLLALMAPDAAADLVGMLHTENARRYLEGLPAQQSECIIELLRYPEDSIGGIMTNDYVCVPENFTVGQARRALRERLKTPDFVYFIYVVSDNKSRLLRGVITLRELLVAEEGQAIAEIMNPYLTTLNPLEPVSEGAFKVINNHVAALPVIGKDGKLLGVVTVDAAAAQVAPPRLREQMPKVFS